MVRALILSRARGVCESIQLWFSSHKLAQIRFSSQIDMAESTTPIIETSESLPAVNGAPAEQQDIQMKEEHPAEVSFCLIF
jgi:hypothetical protein